MKDLFAVVRSPLITEKGTHVAETSNQVVFKVARSATKPEIADAIEKLFGVKVCAVRTINYLGKGRKQGGRKVGRASSWKKAYVTLAEGQSLDLLDEKA